MRNQSTEISSRGRLIDDRKKSANMSGKAPCTASGEPVRAPSAAPIPEKATAVNTA